MGRLAELIEWFIPPGIRNDEVRAGRARFFVQACLLSIFVAGGASLTYFVGEWIPGGISLGILALVLPFVPLLMRVTGSLRLAANTGLAATLLSYTVPTLFEHHLDAPLLALFGLFPYIAVLVLDTRGAVTWLLLTLATLGLISLSHHFDWVPAIAIGRPDFVAPSRSVMLIIITFLFGLRFAVDRQQAVEALHRGARAKSVFLANVSHELRTPMNAVLGLTDLMLSEELPAAQRERLELVQRSGKSLVELLDGLLDLAKIDANKLTITRDDFDLHALVRDLGSLFLPVARKHGLHFRVEGVGEGARMVRGDALRVRQVVGNLVSNAVKFTEKGGVTLRLREPAPGRFELAVIDTGIGISPGALARLFSPFEQADATTTRRFGGTGLGLAVSRQLAQLMGGELSVESAHGQGSCFTLSVPLEASTREAKAPVAEQHRVVPLDSRLPVLVVDDNPVNLTVARALVERAGFGVVTATNGEEALAAVSHQSFAAVLMDCHMPVMDGFEATRRIRALPGDERTVPIYALTASAMPEELEACRQSGMDDCLIKPVSLEALRSRLRKPG
ncbi:MAG: ATP-binding protein [Myxococcota bacterium]